MIHPARPFPRFVNVAHLHGLHGKLIYQSNRPDKAEKDGLQLRIKSTGYPELEKRTNKNFVCRALAVVFALVERELWKQLSVVSKAHERVLTPTNNPVAMFIINLARR